CSVIVQVGFANGYFFNQPVKQLRIQFYEVFVVLDSFYKSFGVEFCIIINCQFLFDFFYAPS
ncbi:MAG: hypothetical protein FWC67_02815, partial [Defluviitaleaceae bacterium]|nr:hypothetical protein [Defluviitaleaceae bacterium]